MSRAVILALAAAAAGLAPPSRAPAQPPADRTAAVRYARAESLQAALERSDALAREQRKRLLLGRRFDADFVTVLLAGSVGDATGRRVAEGARALLADLGAVPPRFVAARVVVAYAAMGGDSILRAEGVDRRVVMMADVSAKPDTAADGAIVAVVMANAFRETLDADWKTWLPDGLALPWKMEREGASAARQLLAGETRSGARCLEGNVAECRLWLGLDRDPHPYAARYDAADIRRVVVGPGGPWWQSSALGLQCAAGADDACLRLAAQGTFAPIPAQPVARASLMREVRTLHGAEALRRALADTAGSVGSRLARAAGVGEDSLVAEWRAWLLTGGGNPRVAAGVGDVMPALVAVGVLLFAAARSGRWR